MRKLFVGVLVTGVALIGQANVAHADTALVTATITSGGIGLRSLTSVPAIALTSSLEDETVDGSMTAIVSEAAVTGDNSWSVTASMSALSSAGATDIANSNLAISGRAVSKLGGGGTATPTSGSQDMSAERTLFTTTGQSTSLIYTGTYTSTANLALTVPNAQAAGVYTGTMTVTLVQ